MQPAKKRQRVNPKDKAKNGKGREWIECELCKKAGITKLSHLKHLTKDCDPKKREARVKELREHKACQSNGN